MDGQPNLTEQNFITNFIFEKILNQYIERCRTKYRESNFL